MWKLAPFCAVVVLFSAASAQAPQLNIAQVLRTIASQAEAAKEYAFEGRIEIAGQRGSDPGKVLADAKVRFAHGPDGKYLLDLEAADKSQYLLASDGQKSWAYVPKLKQYTEEETGSLDADDEEESGGASDSERDLAQTFARQVVPILAGITKNIGQAGLGGEADLAIGKKKVKGPVIRVLSKPNPRNEKSQTDLILDPATLNLARLVHSTVMYEKDVRTVIRLTVDFTRLDLAGPLPDSTFTFAPPKNAKLVETVPIPGQTGSILLNRPAPEFDLKTLDGQRTKLSDLRGHPVLIDFWATWCGPCRKELPSISRIAGEYKDKGLVVLGMNDESKSKARTFADKNGLAFSTLDDSDRKAFRAYRVRFIPAVYLIDADGKVVRFLRGTHTYEALKASLKSVGL